MSVVISSTKTDRKKEVHQFIDGAVGKLELLSNYPKESFASNVIAVVCHPHPLYDGTMNNKVTYTLARTFNRLGMKAVRFNFRGVGASEGEFDNGAGEVDDLLAVLAWVKQQHPQKKIWLAGFSFGAYIALKAAGQFEVDKLITVAPPVNFFDFSGVQTPERDWIIVQGLDDEIVPPQQVIDWVNELPGKPRAIYLDGVGHFFHKRLTLLSDVLEEKLTVPLAAAFRYA